MKRIFIGLGIAFALLLSSCQSCGDEEYSDISGRWVNYTFGPQKLARVEIDQAGEEKTADVDLDLIFDLDAVKPEEIFVEQKISGTITVCDPQFGFSGVYEIDPQKSEYGPTGTCGGDNGFGRIDVLATLGKATVELNGAFICADDPDELTEGSVYIYRGNRENPELHITLLKTDPNGMGTESQISLLRNDEASCDSTVGPADDDDDNKVE